LLTNCCILAVGLFIIWKLLLKKFENSLKELTESMGDDIFESVMPIIEDKIHDSDVIDIMIDKTFQGIIGRFGGDKSGQARQEKAVDKRIIKAVLGTNPLLAGLADQIGIMPYLEKNPNLVFYILHKYPALFQMGAQAGQSMTSPSGSDYTPPQPGPAPSPQS